MPKGLTNLFSKQHPHDALFIYTAQLNKFTDNSHNSIQDYSPVGPTHREMFLELH